MDRRPIVSVVSCIAFLLISSGFIPPKVGAALAYNNPFNQQDSEEPLTMPVGSTQQDAEGVENNRWNSKPYGQYTPKLTRNSVLVDLSAPPFFYSPFLKSLLKRQDKGLMLDIGALAVKNLIGGGGLGNPQVESKQNTVLQGILRHSG